MNASGNIAEPVEVLASEGTLIRSAFSGLQSFADRIQKLETAVDAIADAGGETARAATRKLKQQVRRFEPSVTMIGQVKAGKTTLVNALAGWPGLLPADINPWTSVVTSLHLDPATRSGAGKANFRFFNEEEWDRLLNRGGRVGELAARAGADRELEKVRRQLEEMREKSRQRLGRKFELLMGQAHEYGYVDEELVQRYVCLGDDLDGNNSADQKQGRFADITKSADLYLGHPELPYRLCIRDTPGVNDTFMIREQITVNAIRESRLCVVVLFGAPDPLDRRHGAHPHDLQHTVARGHHLREPDRRVERPRPRNRGNPPEHRGHSQGSQWPDRRRDHLRQRVLGGSRSVTDLQ